jgi:hypothetical protein
MKKNAAPSSPKRGRSTPQALANKKRNRVGGVKSSSAANMADLLSDLRRLIHSARARIATVANAAATQLFWSVGRRLLRENLQQGRAAYGKQILATVSQELTAEYVVAASGDRACARAGGQAMDSLHNLDRIQATL